jgi:hypothetical protein
VEQQGVDVLDEGPVDDGPVAELAGFVIAENPVTDSALVPVEDPGAEAVEPDDEREQRDDDEGGQRTRPGVLGRDPDACPLIALHEPAFRTEV